MPVAADGPAAVQASLGADADTTDSAGSAAADNRGSDSGATSGAPAAASAPTGKTSALNVGRSLAAARRVVAGWFERRTPTDPAAQPPAPPTLAERLAPWTAILPPGSLSKLSALMSLSDQAGASAADWDRPLSSPRPTLDAMRRSLDLFMAQTGDARARELAASLFAEARSVADTGRATPRWLTFFGFRVAALYTTAGGGDDNTLPAGFDPASVVDTEAFLRQYQGDWDQRNTFYDLDFLNRRWRDMPLLVPVTYAASPRLMNAARIAAPNVRIALLRRADSEIHYGRWRPLSTYKHDGDHLDQETGHLREEPAQERFIRRVGETLTTELSVAARVWLDDLFFSLWHDEPHVVKAMLRSARAAKSAGVDFASWSAPGLPGHASVSMRRFIEIHRSGDPAFSFPDTYEGAEAFAAAWRERRLQAEVYDAQAVIMKALWDAA